MEDKIETNKSMSTSTVKHRRGVVTCDITNQYKQKVTIPPFVIPGVNFTGATRSGAYAAFTITNSPALLKSTGESQLLITNASLRENHVVLPHLNTYNLIAATARRKPGTTGAIVAQTIKVYKDSAPDEIIGVFTTKAAGLGEDPVCGFFVSYHSKAAGDSRCNLQTSGVTISCTVDPSLEIVLWIVGT